MSSYNKASMSKDEYSLIGKILSFRIPAYYKVIGLVGALAVFIVLIASNFFGGYSPLVKDLCRSLVLFFLLLASLSSERVEDEFVRHTRAESYLAAFLFALIYAICIPLIALILDVLIVQITGDGKPSFYDISSFEVIFTLVGCQLLFFETLKRFKSCSTD